MTRLASLVLAQAAYDAADEHGDATTCAALVAAFVGADASTLYGTARAPGEASEARNMAAMALPMIDALLAEHTEHVEGGRHPDAPDDPREAFARGLLEFAAENDVAALALVGAEVMFPDYASTQTPGVVHAAVTQVCATVAEQIAASWHPSRSRLAGLERAESAAVTMRDAARLLVAGSHLLDAHVAATIDAAKGAA